VKDLKDTSNGSSVSSVSSRPADSSPAEASLLGDAKANSSKSKEKEKEQEKDLSPEQALLQTVSSLVRGGPEARKKFESKLMQGLMSEKKDSNGETGGGSDPKENKEREVAMESMIMELLDNVENAAGGSVPDGLEQQRMATMSAKEREVHKMEQDQLKQQEQMQIKRTVGRLLGSETMAESNDPEVLKAEAQEEKKEQDRKQNPQKYRDYKLASHFNYNLEKILILLKRYRGDVCIKGTNKSPFANLWALLDKFQSDVKTNKAVEDYVMPIGKFCSRHHKRIQRCDNALILETKEPFLRDHLRLPLLWKTFTAQERDLCWSTAQRGKQLSVIWYQLFGHFKNKPNHPLRPLSEIVEDLLGATEIAPGEQRPGLSTRSIIVGALNRTAGSKNKLKALMDVYQQIEKRKNPKDLRRIIRIVRYILPSDPNDTEDGSADDSNDLDDDSDDEKVDDVKAVSTAADHKNEASLSSLQSQSQKTREQLARLVETTEK
jgi:hypothetical protein